MSKHEPLVHVGYPKTATTWLQKGLFADARYGFCPVEGAPKSFGDYFVHGEPRGLRNPFDFEASKLAARYRALPLGAGRYPVISNEALLCHPFSGGVQAREIALKLKEVFPDALILITIREQISIIVSTYEYYLRLGGLASLERFLSSKCGRGQSQTPLFDHSYFEYDKCIAFYQALFRPDRVLVLPQELLQHEPGRFVRKIYDFVGIEPPSGLGELLTAGHQNVSAKPEACTRNILRVLNLLHSPSNHNVAGLGAKRVSSGIVQFVAGLLPNHVVERYEGRIRRRVAAIVGDVYGVSNWRTEKLTGLGLESLGYRVTSGFDESEEVTEKPHLRLV